MSIQNLTDQPLKPYPDPLIEAYLEYLRNGTDYTSALIRDREEARQKIRDYVSQKVKSYREG